MPEMRRKFFILGGETALKRRMRKWGRDFVSGAGGADGIENVGYWTVTALAEREASGTIPT
jgi:hypothetical protein